MKQKNNITNYVIIAVIALLIGGFVGAIQFSNTETITVDKEVIKEITVEVEKIVEVETEVENAELYKDNALADLLDARGEKSRFLKCTSGGYEFDLDEVTATVRDWSIEFEDDDYTVEIEVKLKYADGIERACKTTRTYEIVYEEGEEPEVDRL